MIIIHEASNYRNRMIFNQLLEQTFLTHSKIEFIQIQ